MCSAALQDLNLFNESVKQNGLITLPVIFRASSGIELEHTRDPENSARSFKAIKKLWYKKTKKKHSN